MYLTSVYIFVYCDLDNKRDILIRCALFKNIMIKLSIHTFWIRKIVVFKIGKSNTSKKCVSKNVIISLFTLIKGGFFLSV